MKTRRVFVVIEAETSHPLSQLRRHGMWWATQTRILQVQVNVAQDAKRKKKARRKA